MPNAGALTRADRRRSERSARLRSIVRRDYAVVALASAVNRLADAHAALAETQG